MNAPRVDRVLHSIRFGIDEARDRMPGFSEGLVFVVIVADPHNGDVAWACSENDDVAARLAAELLSDVQAAKGGLQ
jgi:hypothetical protein